MSKKRLSWKDVKVGEKYKALVDQVRKDQALILKLKHNQSIKGICFSNEICEDKNNDKAISILNQFEVGDYVKVYVLSVDPQNKKMKLSIKPSYFNKDDEEPFDSDDDLPLNQEVTVEEQSKKRKLEQEIQKKENEMKKQKNESDDLEDESDQR
jgi:rRNA biogenesis protein RRP5